MVIPLYRADPQTLLTRPPLVTQGASSSVLPSDLHVLGLPPAFNLSHDQTLQFKFDLLKHVKRCSSVKRHNEFHYVFTREALIFFKARRLVISILRVPTQMV